MYATDGWTDGQNQRLLPLSCGRGHNNVLVSFFPNRHRPDRLHCLQYTTHTVISEWS